MRACASEERHRLVQAAELYFMTDEDTEGDTGSLIGFDDARQSTPIISRMP